MKLYLTNSSIPELQGVSKEDQREAMKYGNKKARSHWQFYLGVILMAVIVYAGVHFFGIIGAGLGGGLGAFIFMQFTIPIARPYMAEYLSNNKPSQ